MLVTSTEAHDTALLSVTAVSQPCYAVVTQIQSALNSGVAFYRYYSFFLFLECMEYNKDTVQRVEVIPLLSDPKPSGVLITKCKFDSVPLVVGGKPALPGEFPFMVLSQ